jgi:biotin synthase
VGGVLRIANTIRNPLLDTKQILEKAIHDNTQGVVRFSLVTSGHKLNEEEVDKVCQTVQKIKHKQREPI